MRRPVGDLVVMTGTARRYVDRRRSRSLLPALPDQSSLLRVRTGGLTCPVPASRPLAVTRQRDGTSGSPRPRDHLAGLREHHGVAGAGSSTMAVAFAVGADDCASTVSVALQLPMTIVPVIKAIRRQVMLKFPRRPSGMNSEARPFMAGVPPE